jgi:hypothetical protein
MPGGKPKKQANEPESISYGYIIDYNYILCLINSS